MNWKTLPGLRGLACSGFRAIPTAAPDIERGVAVEFGSDTEREAFLRRLEEYFAAQRFSNAAAAFEAVKSVVLDWTAKNTSG